MAEKGMKDIDSLRDAVEDLVRCGFDAAHEGYRSEKERDRIIEQYGRRIKYIKHWIEDLIKGPKVRCKKCRYHDTSYAWHPTCNIHGGEWHDDDYCSYGDLLEFEKPIKDCPFCGSTAELIEIDSSDFGDGSMLYCIRCTNEGCYANQCHKNVDFCYGESCLFNDKEECVNAWNKRV